MTDNYDAVGRYEDAPVRFVDEIWVWRATGEPLSCDECEQMGLDGTLRTSSVSDAVNTKPAVRAGRHRAGRAGGR